MVARGAWICAKTANRPIGRDDKQPIICRQHARRLGGQRPSPRDRPGKLGIICGDGKLNGQEMSAAVCVESCACLE